MKVLLLAPQPFYQDRGTPIAVDLMLRVLSARGDEVDVLAYHEGAPVHYPHVTMHRIPRIPFVRGIEPGPSLKKLICDTVFFVTALRMAARNRYQLVHAVEESAFVALVIKRFHGIPYVYDMDSSMADQTMAKYRPLRILGWWLRWCEGLVIRHAEVVVPVCDALARVAANRQARRMVVLRDVSLLSINGHGTSVANAVRVELGITGPIVMYVGNLERYQGIDLLLESFAMARQRVPTAQLVIIGGSKLSIERYRARARQLGLDSAVHFAGPRPVARIADYLEGADVLASPRLQGGNTPMKTYSYLHSGKAVLATDLPTHTQVLNDEVALLTRPDPAAFADGLVRLLENASLRERLGQAGRQLVEARYSYPAFQTTVKALYDGLSARAMSHRDRAITILHVTDKFGTEQTNMHGTAHVFAKWLPDANQHGTFRHELCSLRSRNAAARTLEGHGLTVHYLRTGKFNPLAIWRLWRLVRRLHPRVLHLHEFGSQAVGRIVARMCRLPAVLHIHMETHTVPWYLRLVNHALEHDTTRAIAVSEAAKRFGSRELGIREDKIVVIPNGIELGPCQALSVEQRVEAKSRRGIPEDHQVIGTIGRLERVKGQEYLLRAMPHILRACPHTTCVLIGDGSQRAALEALADRLLVRPNSMFAGYSDEVASWLTLFDVHVIPSLSEGFSLAAVEAMACGLPQVATRAGALPELIEDGRTGYLVPPGNPEALAERIVALLQDPAARSQMGQRARVAAERYSLKAMVEHIEAIYDKVCAPTMCSPAAKSELGPTERRTEPSAPRSLRPEEAWR